MFSTPKSSATPPTPDLQPHSQSPFARFDPVTYLPNRLQFNSDYGQPRAPGAQVIMATLCDALHFNALMRALGHEYSEDFIRAGAARIRECIPPEIEIYHVSVLSFVMICPCGAELLIKDLIQSWIAPLICGGIPIVTRLGLGIADCADTNPAIALRNALAATDDSRRGVTGWARYNSATDGAHRRSFLLLSDLPGAMASTGELNLHFQPKYNLANGLPTGAEALLRWNHPGLGSVSPGEFVPLAENTALITDLTGWVLNAAAEQAAAWHRQGLRLNMAINVSPRNLSQTGFADSVLALLGRHDIAPPTIELEFTEGTLVSNDQVVRAELQILRDAGVHIALDDFGTGFSNLSYITHLPADIIKIDKSFIQPIGSDIRSAELVHTLIQLAHKLDYAVVAEGIENAVIYEMLAGWGCDEGQGFHMSKPLAAADFEQLMAAGR